MLFMDLSSPEFPVTENDANKITRIVLHIGKNMFWQMTFPKIWCRQMKTETEIKIQ